jgi:hypothetical protein
MCSVCTSFGSLVLTDSLAALQALNPATSDQLTEKLLLNLSRLLHPKRVVLLKQWIPANVEIPGNERVDHLAKEGSYISIIPTPFRTLHGRLHQHLRTLGTLPNCIDVCECGISDQTSEHILQTCPVMTSREYLEAENVTSSNWVEIVQLSGDC